MLYFGFRVSFWGEVIIIVRLIGVKSTASFLFDNSACSLKYLEAFS